MNEYVMKTYSNTQQYFENRISRICKITKQSGVLLCYEVGVPETFYVSRRLLSYWKMRFLRTGTPQNKTRSG